MRNLAVGVSALVLLTAVPVASGMGANDPIADNNLGKIARTCAAALCPDTKDSLQLWMELQPVCMGRTKGILSNFQVLPGESADGSNGASISLWSPFVVGAACALAAMVGVVFGLRSGAQMGMKYSRIEVPRTCQP
eukprot:TRINITY_DN6339_c0_g1_i2.p2 TRINITY_DN6339_c0_g1~~TRINITY_DN6339_c0_g1_i2.p2  ORF type:complete len:136 (-),score=26.03 TRINITY_DN6339_c0_g1_i2:310-717(-)